MAQKKTGLLILFMVFVPVFSIWLMFHTFSVSNAGSQLLISAKAWSDFGSHIPLIRSFSRGVNWPPQYPLYPGESIRYHYLFYSTVGWLERLGIRIDVALNIPSALGLSALIFMVFVLASRMFKSLFIGLLSASFVLFNSSLSFLDFFAKHSISSHTLTDIIENSVFPSFGPWNGSLITAFWNLNIFTNQRHLGLSFAVLLLAIYVLYLNPKRIYLIGFLIGSLILLNQAALIAGLIFCLWFFVRRPQYRVPLLFSGIGSLPWLMIAFTTLKLTPQLSFQPGYLVPQPMTILSFLKFWVLNLGLNLLLIPIGLILAPKSARIFIIPTLILFTIGNLWKFSPDMINNHKLFNFFMIIGSMFSANLLTKILKLKLIGVLLFLTLTLALTLGGLIDLFPVINDRYLSISDAPDNPDISYFLSLPPKSVVLNSYWFYHPASLAGKSIYNGYSYFTWSHGYDQISREKSAVEIYLSHDKNTVCSRLLAAHIDYVEISPNHEPFISPEPGLWQYILMPDFYNPKSGITVYSVSKNCL